MKTMNVAVSSAASRLRPWLLGLSIALAGAPAAAQAQAAGADNWPSAPIRLVVPYPPGGGTDTMGRVVGEALGKQLGQTVIVENRAGASGMIGTVAVARAKPDGYTLLFGTGAALTGAANPGELNGRPFEPLKDMQPITFVGGGPYVLITNKDFPPNTLPELVEYAKKHPGKVNYASPGVETLNYMLLEALNLDRGIKTTHVPYKGSAELMHNLMAGFVQYTLDTPGTTLPLIRDGKVKAIALLHPQRLEKLPDLATAPEQGFPELVGGSWYGLLAPAGLPEPILKKLHAAAVAALKMPEVKQVFDQRDVLVSGNTPDEFMDFLKAETRQRAEIQRKVRSRAE